MFVRKFISVVLACVFMSVGVGFSRPVEDYDFPNNEDALILGQAMVGEADWNTEDHIAIAFVLQKRYKVWKNAKKKNGKFVKPHQTFGWFIKRYCSLFKVSSKRAERIKNLPWGNPTHFPTNVSRRRYTENWKKVRKTVEKFFSGLYNDPCPSAMHWGGTMDSPDDIVNPRAAKWSPVNCGKTHNIFYRPKF